MLLFLMLNLSEDTLQRLHVYCPLAAYSKKFFFPVCTELDSQMVICSTLSCSSTSKKPEHSAAAALRGPCATITPTGFAFSETTNVI